MRIVYLYPSLAVVGGIERILVDKMNYLVHHEGYEVYMVTSDQGQHPIPYDLDERVHLIDLNIRFHSRYQYKLWRRLIAYRRLSKKYHDELRSLFRKILPDVIVCTSSQHVRPLLKIKGNIPLMVESHINFSHPDTWLHCVSTLINNYWIGKAEAVVTLTEGDAVDWRRVCKHVYVIPNIVHLNESGKYSDCTNKRVIFVGRLVAQKGLLDLLKVWELVHQKHPDWQLDIYGEGKMDSIPEMNLYVHSPVSNIIEKYTECSMLLLTSVYEPFGLVIPEAMSCGIPVVAFDCPHGPACIISDGIDGFIVKNRSINEYINNVFLLMEDEGLRLAMGRAGVQSSLRYESTRIMPQWIDLFQILIKNSH
jgi:glycosyltransferase involved in cell wall biosynthesis